MRGAVARRHGPLDHVVSVELPDAGYAEHLAQELRDLVPAATIERSGSVGVGIYGVGEENRLLIEVLGAVQLWRAPSGMESVRVRNRDKRYVVEADSQGERGSRLSRAGAEARLNH